MKNFIRRMCLGFRKDREEMSLTISLHLNILLLMVRHGLKNIVMLGVIASTVYWLLFLTMSLSPIFMISSPIWLAYTQEYRDLAACFALVIVVIGIFLYALRIYEIGRFVENRYIEEDILFSEEQVKSYTEILDEESSNQYK